MVELVHGPMPNVLAVYLIMHPSCNTDDFEHDPIFQAIKPTIKQQLNRDQDGLCVYCERKILPNDGHIEHIKPKRGVHAHPHLCFSYNNFAQSCNDKYTCGSKKKSGLLPIEPHAGCNDFFSLSITGEVTCITGLTRRERHEVRMTRDMLGLNKPHLVKEREKWCNSIITILKHNPSANIDDFLKDKPFRFILKRMI